MAAILVNTNTDLSAAISVLSLPLATNHFNLCLKQVTFTGRIKCWAPPVTHLPLPGLLQSSIHLLQADHTLHQSPENKFASNFDLKGILSYGGPCRNHTGIATYRVKQGSFRTPATDRRQSHTSSWCTASVNRGNLQSHASNLCLASVLGFFAKIY